MLDNVNNLIEGSGRLGDAQMTLINAAKGTISATGTASQLVINTGANVVGNSGLIESVGPAGLLIQSTTVNNGTLGVISAAGGNVYLQGATIQGGTLNGSGTFIEQSGSTLDSSTNSIINDTTVEVSNNTQLYLLGTLTNTGTIAVSSNANATSLIVGPGGTTPGTMTLSGGGQVILSDNSNNFIYGQIGGDTLVNLNNTISGAGDIGDNQLVLINDATIDANGSNTLTLVTDNVITNNALLESTGTGGLLIQNSTVNNGTTGTISAAGGNVTLTNATVQGGTLNGTGSFIAVNNSTLDGTANTLTNDTTVNLFNNNAMFLLGTLDNVGTLAVNSTANSTVLEIGPGTAAGTVTLTGGGQVILSNNNNNYLYGRIASDTLVNLNNTISGAGVIGDNQLILINDATIDANDSTGLLINTTGFTNNGLLESTGTGGMTIAAAISNASGTVAAAGGNITLQGATIAGGTLTSSGGATVFANSGAVLDGSASALTNLASVVVQNNTTANLKGAIVNEGTITVGSTANTTELIIDSAAVTLTGKGTLALTNNSQNFVLGAAAANVLDNVNNIIIGAGNLGDGQLTLINGGIIEANDSTGLVIDVGTTGTNTAGGQMLGVGAGGLSIENGTYTNLGLIQADNGSTVTFQSNAVLTNSANGTLTGGAYGAISTGNDATLSVTGSAIVVDAADIILSGQGSTIDFGGTSVDASLDMIAAGGTLAVLGGRNFNVVANGGVLTNNGVLSMGGGTFTAAGLTMGTAATISGFGTVVPTVSEIANGTLTGGTFAAVGGTLALTGSAIKVDASDIIFAGKGAAMTFSGTALTSSLATVTTAGTLAVQTGATYTETANGGALLIDGLLSMGGGEYIGAGALTIASGATLQGFGTVASSITDSGTIIASGGVLVLSKAITGTVGLQAAAGATLKLSAGGTLSQPISGAGTLEIGATYALGATAPTTASIETAAGALLTGAGHLTSAITDLGTIESLGGTLVLDGAISSGTGTLEAAAGTLLDLTGGGSFTGALSGAGTVKIGSILTLHAGASLSAANVIESASVTLGANTALVNSVGHAFDLTAASGKTIIEHGSTGASFSNAGSLLANGAGIAESSVALINSGNVSVSSGTLAFLSSVTNTGTIDAASGVLSSAKTIAGTGTLEVGATGTLSLLDGAAAGQTTNFLAGTGLLDLTIPKNFLGTIGGFGGSDQINLLNTTETSFGFANNVLTVKDGTATVATLHFTGTYTQADFGVTNDGHGNTVITFL